MVVLAVAGCCCHKPCKSPQLYCRCFQHLVVLVSNSESQDGMTLRRTDRLSIECMPGLKMTTSAGTQRRSDLSLNISGLQGRLEEVDAVCLKHIQRKDAESGEVAPSN